MSKQQKDNGRIIKETETFYCSLEGESQEKEYFDRIEELVKTSNSKKQVKFRYSLSSSSGGDALEVVKRLIAGTKFYDKKVTNGKMAAIFDYDGKDKRFKDAIDLCDKNNIKHAYSNYCFELWLLLHKTDCPGVVTDAQGYDDKIIKTYNLVPGDNLKSQRIMKKIVNQITLNDIYAAIARAKRIEEKCKDTGIVIHNGKECHYQQPFLKIHVFLEEVFGRIGLL